MIAVIDYGMGNLKSVSKALEFSSAETFRDTRDEFVEAPKARQIQKVCVTNKAKDIEKCDKIVFPGVGAFGAAISNLKKLKLIPVLVDQINNKKPFLGLCLGLQVLFEASLESKSAKGLCAIAGNVKKFKPGIKIPHIGWNQINIKKSHPLLKGVANKSFFYFCHSYYVNPLDKDLIFATSNYGCEFPAIVIKDNLFGIQFHPEKSQELGLKMLKNFVEL